MDLASLFGATEPIKVGNFDARPNTAKRRANGPRLPLNVEMLLALAARKLYAGIANAMKAAVLPKVGDFAKPETEERTDAKKPKAEEKSPNAAEAKRVSSHARAVARRALARGLPAFEARSKVAADRTEKHSKKELERLGIKGKDPPELKWLVDGWRKDNIAKVKDLADHQANRIEKILADGFNRKPESIAKDIEELVNGVGERSAQRIASQQVLKLNSQINRYRMEHAGVESYTWTTQNDDRVRDAHADLDGEEFTWESGGDPDEGHPGEAPNCRCIAWPNPPEKSADEEDD